MADMIGLLDALGASGRCGWATTGAPGGLEPGQPPPRALPGGGQPLRAVLHAGAQLGRHGRPGGPAEVYPADQFPVGQWDYQLPLPGRLDRAAAVLTPTPTARSSAVPQGQPRGLGQPAVTASIGRSGGWFGGAEEAPDLPARRRRRQRRRPAHLRRGPDPQRLRRPERLVHEPRGQRRLRGPGRRRRPPRHARAVPRGPLRLRRARWARSRLAEPHAASYVTDLTERMLDCGHWMAAGEGPPRSTPRWSRGCATACPPCGPRPERRCGDRPAHPPGRPTPTTSSTRSSSRTNCW